MHPFPSQTVYVGIAFSSVLPALIAPAAVTAVQAQVTETTIYVDPRAGNDQTGTGSEDQPYQTLTQALEAASADAVIQLARGTYSEETGEIFPIVVKKPVEIRGVPGNQGYRVKIQGGGRFNSPTGAGQTVGIALLADATLTGVTVTNLRDRGHGVWIEGANPTVTQNTLTRNDNTGVSVNGTGQPKITDNYFYNNVGNGMVIYGETQPLVKNNTFHRTGFGISVTEQATPQIIGNELKDNRIGIIVEEQGKPVLRENVIELSREDGLVAISNSRPDLGTAKEPGGNIFRRNRGNAIKNLTKNYVIPANGNQIAGNTQGKIDRRGTVTAQTSPPPLDSRLPPRSRNDGQTNLSANSDNGSSTAEQVWTAPDASSRRLPPLQNSRTETRLPPPNPNAANSPSTASTPSPNPNSNTSRPQLKDLLVLEPNVSPSNPPSQRNLNALPVPSGNIPSGRPFSRGASPEERAAAVGGKYRVIVEITRASDKTKVKDIVPEAFTSRYQGRRVMQVGIFQSQANAREIRQRLEQEGLQVRVIRL
ncbi:MAG: DUF1565 domain-containing protein [Halothece sp.]